MMKSKEEIWTHMENLNLSRIFIMFSAKYKKKFEKVEFIIQSIMPLTKCGKNNVDWNDEIFKEKSFLTQPIFDEYEKIHGKVDGMLVWNNETKKVILTSKITKKILELVKKEL